MRNYTRNDYLILSIFVAGLLVGGIILYAQLVWLPNPNQTASDTMAQQQQIAASQTVPSNTKSAQAGDVSVPNNMTNCKVQDDCIAVDTTCGYCCNYRAINSTFEAAYNQRFAKSCANYKGSTCKCYDMETYPTCINRTCRLVKWPDIPNDINKPLPAAKM